MHEGMCACGLPLHYRSVLDQFIVDLLTSQAGGDPNILVASPTGTYRVQRHYIALHGLRETELLALASRGVITKLS